MEMTDLFMLAAFMSKLAKKSCHSKQVLDRQPYGQGHDNAQQSANQKIFGLFEFIVLHDLIKSKNRLGGDQKDDGLVRVKQDECKDEESFRISDPLPAVVKSFSVYHRFIPFSGSDADQRTGR